jgi:hypothetical protein
MVQCWTWKKVQDQQTKRKRNGAVAQVVECLPSKEALSSISNTTKNGAREEE